MQSLLNKLKDKFTKERFSVGLDIGSHTIKMVKLKFIKDRVELCNFALAGVEPDLGEALKRVKASEGIDRVNIGVSGPATVVRYVNFPRMSESELRGALKFEAEKHIPFSFNEVNLDGYILKEDQPENKMLVLLAAVKKELIYQRLKLIEDAGLRVNLIDIDSLALINAFNFNYPLEDNSEYKAVGLLNIGSSITNLDILEAGIPRLSRDIQFAGNNFTHKLMDTLGVDFRAAEEIKLNPGTKETDKITVAIESALPNLSAEIMTSFDYYESQSASSISKIFLGGGGSLFFGLKDMLGNLLGIEVEYWQPLKEIKLSSSIDPEKINLLSNQLAVAVGLALRQ